MDYKFYSAVVFSMQIFEGDTLKSVEGGVEEIFPTIDEAVQSIEDEIDLLRQGFNRREGFVHHLLDSKLSSELEERTKVFYTYRVNYGYGCYAIFRVHLQSICNKHIHI